MLQLAAGIGTVVGLASWAISNKNNAPLPPPDPPVIVAADSNKIMVVLSAYKWTEAILTIKNILETACVPHRVSIGLALSPNAGVSQAEAELYFHKKRFVRVIVHPPHLNLGIQPTRQYCLQKLYYGEKYLLIMHAHSRMCKDWDIVCTSSLQYAYARDFHVISMVPMESTAKCSVPPLATYACLQPQLSFKKGVPVFIPTFVAEAATELSAQPLVCGKCLFGEADVLLKKADLITYAIPFATAEEDDVLLSQLFWDRGILPMTPLSSILVHISCQKRRNAATDYQSKILKRYTKNILLAVVGLTSINSCDKASYIADMRKDVSSYVQTFLDMDFGQRRVAGYRVMGLTSAIPSSFEITEKYKTQEAFDEQCERLCY